MWHLPFYVHVALLAEDRLTIMSLWPRVSSNGLENIVKTSSSTYGPRNVQSPWARIPLCEGRWSITETRSICRADRLAALSTSSCKFDVEDTSNSRKAARNPRDGPREVSSLLAVVLKLISVSFSLIESTFRVQIGQVLLVFVVKRVLRDEEVSRC